jgi:hypothetical protein
MGCFEAEKRGYIGRWHCRARSARIRREVARNTPDDSNLFDIVPEKIAAKTISRITAIAAFQMHFEVSGPTIPLDAIFIAKLAST